MRAIWAASPVNGGARQHLLTQMLHYLRPGTLEPVQQRSIGAQDAVLFVMHQNAVRNGIEGACQLVPRLHYLFQQSAVFCCQPNLFGGGFQELIFTAGVSAKMRHPKNEHADCRILSGYRDQQKMVDTFSSKVLSQTWRGLCRSHRSEEHTSELQSRLH